jgi:regulator of protease activity HflC (stomatin/prohibitin superfamily)
MRERITIREQIIDIPSQSVITKDNVNITVDGLVFCKIQNAKEAIYNVVSFFANALNAFFHFPPLDTSTT